MARTRTRTPLYALAAVSAVATFGITAGVASALTTSGPGPVPVSGPVAVLVTTPAPTGNPNIVLQPLPDCRTVPTRCVVIPRHCVPASANPVRSVVVQYCPTGGHRDPGGDKPHGDQPGGDKPHGRNPGTTPSDPPVQRQLPAATPIQPASAEPTFTG